MNDHIDVAVFGGGIAGISCAEILSRSGVVRVVLIEQSQRLGDGASSRLQGWFHTGDLYRYTGQPVVAQLFKDNLTILEKLYGPTSNSWWGRAPFFYVPSGALSAQPPPCADQAIQPRPTATHLEVECREARTSEDRSMNVRRILLDLTASMLGRGADVLVGWRASEILASNTGRISRVICTDTAGNTREVSARWFVFCGSAGTWALGAVTSGLVTTRHVLLAGFPALASVNLCYLGGSADDSFSHICREVNGGTAGATYSVVSGDGAATSLDGSPLAAREGRLVNMARHVFGRAACDERQFIAYDCAKVELQMGRTERFHSRVNCGRYSNGLSIVPGKFTLFPMVADEVRRVVLGDGAGELMAMAAGSLELQERAEALVAESYPWTLLAGRAQGAGIDAWSVSVPYKERA